MEFWDIVSVLAIIAVLAVAWWGIRRLDQNAKWRSRDRAYKLLDQDNPSVREMKSTIRDLQLYGGRLKRNKEFQQLRQRLTEKLEMMEGASAK